MSLNVGHYAALAETRNDCCRLRGGGGSHARTRLQVQIPANREKYREFHTFLRIKSRSIAPKPVSRAALRPQTPYHTRFLTGNLISLFRQLSGNFFGRTGNFCSVYSVAKFTGIIASYTTGFLQSSMHFRPISIPLTMPWRACELSPCPVLREPQNGVNLLQ